MKKEPSPMQKTLNVWAISLLIWTLYRHFYGAALPIWVDEFILKPMVFIMPAAIFIVRFEKKQFFEEVWLSFSSWKSDVAYGLVVGSILFISGMALNLMKHGSVIPQDSSIFGQETVGVVIVTVLFYIAVSVATSISEETLSRGFLLKRLHEEWKNIYVSILVSSMLFFTMRIPIILSNPGISGMTILQVMLTDLIFGLTVSFLFLQSRSLLLTIIIHSCYALSLYLFI